MTDDVPTAFSTRQWSGWSASLSLTLLRLILVPALVIMPAMHVARWTFAVVLTIGFVSDVLDGIVARRFGVATSFLRRLDSAVDIVFYLGVAYAAWELEPAGLRAIKWWVVAIISGEAVNHAFAVWKFGKEPSYHAYSAKLWGLLLFLSLLLLLGAGNTAMLSIAVGAGILAQAEVFAITVVLPAWRHDVRSVWHALADVSSGSGKAN
ncbi:MAG: CDP-alcohol phosphatidyltransferase family protein [bacterium]